MGFGVSGLLVVVFFVFFGGGGVEALQLGPGELKKGLGFVVWGFGLQA